MKISSSGKFLGVFIKRGNKKIVNNYYFDLLSLLKLVLDNNKFISYSSVESYNRKFPIIYFLNLLKKLEPIVNLRSKKKGGLVYKVPSYSRSKSFKIKTVVQWFSKLSLKRTKILSLEKLFDNFYVTLQNQGLIVKQKSDLYKTSINNRPYLKFIKKQNIIWPYISAFKSLKYRKRKYEDWIQYLIHIHKKYKYKLKRWYLIKKAYKKAKIKNSRVLKKLKPFLRVKNKLFLLKKINKFQPKWLFSLKKDQLYFLFHNSNIFKTITLRDSFQKYLTKEENLLKSFWIGKKRFLLKRKQRWLKNKKKFKKKKKNKDHKYPHHVWQYWKKHKKKIYSLGLQKKYKRHSLIKDARNILKTLNLRTYKYTTLGFSKFNKT